MRRDERERERERSKWNRSERGREYISRARRGKPEGGEGNKKINNGEDE